MVTAVQRFTTTPASSNDADLVARFKAGDASAFDEIVALHSGRIFSIAMNHIRNRADAEEITQDTLIRAHRGLPGFRGESSLATWLHQIALNLSRNRYWHSFRRHSQDMLSLDAPLGHDGGTNLAELVSSDAPNPLEERSTSEFEELVADCMRTMSSQQSEILRLRNVLHKSYGEIGRQLGLSIGTVKSRISRARETLRAKLVELSPEFAAGLGGDLAHKG